MEMQENKNTPLVSVYVLTYNHGKFLRQCLDGIIEQKTSFAFEIIAVDDCSTDDTRVILKEYADSYPSLFRLVLLDENWYSQKRCKTSRIALPLARGKYLAICEGDDFWTYPLKLQRMADGLECNPEYSCFFHSFAVKNETDNPALTYSPRLPAKKDVDFYDILIEPQIQTASCLIRLDSLQPFERITEIYEHGHTAPNTDIILFAILLTKGRIHGIPDKWSVYRIHDKGIWSSQRNGINDIEIINRNIYNLSCDFPEFSWLLKHKNVADLLSESSRLASKKRYCKSIFLKLKALSIRPQSFFTMYLKRYFPNSYNRSKWKEPEFQS